MAICRSVVKPPADSRKMLPQVFFGACVDMHAGYDSMKESACLNGFLLSLAKGSPVMEYTHYEESAAFIKSKIDFVPEVGLVLGTALGLLTQEMEDAVEIPYSQIPHFLTSTAPGHAGKLILGTLAGKKVACMSGRFHYYEGYSYEQLALPVRLFQLLGVKTVILTNAAGAINTGYHVGDVMILKDHINFAGASPMRGKNMEAFGPRFFDLGNVYTASLRALAMECAKGSSLTVHEGVYQFFVGPHFETPSEIRAARILGADAAGMSTVTEALTAAHCGLPVLALSLMVNMAAGVLDVPISTHDIDEAADRVALPLRQYVREIVSRL